MALPTFGIWRRKRPLVLDHKCQLIDGLECSSEEFYEAIRRELEHRKVPGLEITHENFAEGGLLSDGRIYLRMRRERLLFDVCSAPFGNAQFFSYRFSEIPPGMMLWELLLVLALLAGVAAGYLVLFGLLWGVAIFGGTLLGFAMILRNSSDLGLADLDARLLAVPVLGAVYEFLLRKETYFREDTRVMYVTLVRAVIEASFEQFALEKGFEQVQFLDVTPEIHPKLGALLRQPV